MWSHRVYGQGEALGQRIYGAIDLKSFYASAECVDRGLDPMKTNLVVADPGRTEKTICLAVTPALKVYGVPGRARLFEVVQRVGEVNARRRWAAPGQILEGSSWDADRLASEPRLALDYLVAPPRMARYMELSAQIYRIYLQFMAPEDIYVYSVDEVFLDLTPYLRTGGLSPRAFVSRMVRAVLEATGITAVAGLGTNLYLCKVALDILAKHAQPDGYGVRIAALDEGSYRRQLWDHQPLTDFWRVGPGITRRLQKCGIRTMGDIARCSLGGPGDFWNEELLFRAFGVNAELLIDHAWGVEPCSLGDIKAYRPGERSLSSGQVLSRPYPAEQGRLVAREMTELLAMDLLAKGMTCDRLTLTVGYDRESLLRPYEGPVALDHYGRAVPRHAHGTQNLGMHLSSAKALLEAVGALWDRIVDPRLLVRRITIGAGRLLAENELPEGDGQLCLFGAAPARDPEALARERRQQEAVLRLRRRFGKNAVLRGMNLQEGATARERNGQVGGHRA